MSQIKVDSIVPRGGLPAGASGGIIQVVQAVKTDTASHDTTTWTDISGLSVTITPQSASNKVLVSFSGTGSTVNMGFVRIMRGSTVLAVGDSSGSRVPCTCQFHRSGDSNYAESFGFTYLDSPSTTSSTTYKLQWRDENGTIYLNRTADDQNSSAGPRAASVITVMEVTM